MVGLLLEHKNKLLLAGGVLLALFLAFAFGRYSVPPKVQLVESNKETVKVVEKVDEKKLMELVEELKWMRTQLTEVKKSIHREETTVTHADGSSETKKTEDINVSKVVKEQEVKFIDREVKVQETKYVDRIIDRVVEVTKTKTIEPYKPQWAVGGLVGIDVGNITTPTLSYGVEAQHRIFSTPIWGGLWGMASASSKQAGLSIRVEF